MGPALSLLRRLLADNPRRSPFEERLLAELDGKTNAGEDRLARRLGQDANRLGEAAWANQPGEAATPFRISCGEAGCLFKIDR